jgi:uncharacterized protein
VRKLPVTNPKFTEELGRRLHRPAVFRVAAALLRRIGGDFANELCSAASAFEAIL